MSEEIENIIEESLSPDRYCLVHNYIVSLQQKVEQLENMRKEAVDYMKENCDIITIDRGWIIRSELTTTGLGKLFKILNKGE